MPNGNCLHLSPTERSELRARVDSASLHAAARQLGVSHATLARAIEGKSLRPKTASKLRSSPRVRDASEFNRGAVAVEAPRRFPGALAFDSQDDALEWVRAARDCQVAGRFRAPVQLATVMRTDDALYTAYHARVSPQRVLASRLVPYPSTRGESVAAKAREHCIAPRDVLQTIAGTRANHGVAVGKIEREVNDSGTMVSFRLTEWPLEYVRVDHNGQLQTQTRDHGIVPIVHGDGVWVVFAKFDPQPWLHEAALLPASFVYAAHADGIADMAGASRAHGLAKVMGELPPNVAMRDSGGVKLSPEADAYLNMLADLVSGAASAGVHAHGGDAKFLANGSTAWQIFTELIQNRERAAARIYVGTDAYLGSVGDAPGVDIAALFGVASTKLQGDLDNDSSALTTGFYQPWTAINFGDSRYAPRHEYQVPDPDKAKRDAQNANAHDRLMQAVKERRENRLVVDQAVVNELAARFGVEPAPTVAEATETASTVNLAPTDVAKVVRVREARSAQGLPPFGDERDDMTLTELEAYIEARAETRAEARSSQLALDYNPNQPRDADGKFGSGGGGDKTDASGSRVPSKERALAEAEQARAQLGDVDSDTAAREYEYITESRDPADKPDWYDEDDEIEFRSDRALKQHAIESMAEQHGFEVRKPSKAERRNIRKVEDHLEDSTPAYNQANRARFSADELDALSKREDRVRNTLALADAGAGPALDKVNELAEGL